jgi:eukaryotic-like serine/threonine-protein kinase
MALQIDSLLNNRYRIKAILGQGGMGAVYHGVDETLGIQIAVKENLFLSEEYAKQFQKEAIILANLRHPNLPRVGDYFYIENQGQYLIMDYIEGEDLRERIERLGLIPQSEAIVIGAVICDALAYLSCRDNPIIHRDIKPGNIKITYTGEISLVDFGLAKIMDSGGQITSTGARAMTPGYSPPEQYGTGRTDVRSDIYSLGATIYAAVTGTIPEDALSRVTGKVQLTPIHEIMPDVNRKFEKAILKAMEIEADNRYQTPDDFKIALLDAGNLPNVLPLNLLIPPPPTADEISNSKPERRASIEYATSPYFLEPLKEFTQSQLSSQRTKHPKRNLVFFTLITAGILLIITGAIFSYQQRVFKNFLATVLNNGSITEAAPFNESYPGPTSENQQPNLSPSPVQSDNTATALVESRENYPIVGGGANQIVFSSDRTSRYQLWIMNSNGTEQKQLTNLDDGACQPNWSPDGRKIAFISPCSDKQLSYKNSMIYVYTMEDGSIEEMPKTQIGDYNPAWSPDGNRMAFSSYRNGVSHIFLYSYLTDTLEELSDTHFPDMQPVWHPDGKQIAVIRKIYFPHVWIISDTGVTQYQFSASGNQYDYWPNWSPDGQDILYTRSQESPDIPWLVSQEYEDRGTAIATKIPVKYNYIERPVLEGRYSPDGNWIIFESWPDGTNHDIYMMDINGGNVMRLTTDPGVDYNPAWRPRIQ